MNKRKNIVYIMSGSISNWFSYFCDSENLIEVIFGNSEMKEDILKEIERVENTYGKTVNIYIISSGSQNDLALTFRDKMARIGKHVNVYQSIDEPYYEACYLNKGDACFILISYTGETQNCIRMANKLNERNIDFITITSFGTNTLSSLSRCVLHVSTREKIRNNLGTFSMNLSTLYLLDLFYSMYFSLNYKENKKKKIKIADEYENFTSSLIRDTNNDLIK